MGARIATLVLVAAFLSLIGYGGAQWSRSNSRARAAAVSRLMTRVDAWHPVPKRLIRAMAEKYGPPNATGAAEVRWDRRGPWKRIVITNNPVSPLEQVVDYSVPEEKVDELKRFPHGLVVVDPQARELGARSDREETNRLTLNLADEIARGERTVEQADGLYLRTMSLTASGKKSKYTERLLLRTEDPWRERASGPAW